MPILNYLPDKNCYLCIFLSYQILTQRGPSSGHEDFSFCGSLYVSLLQKTNGFHWYSKTQNMLRMVQKGYDDVLSQYEVLVMPTVKFLPPPLPLEDASIKGKALHQRFLYKPWRPKSYSQFEIIINVFVSSFRFI